MATTSASWTIHRNGSRKTIQSQRHWPNQVSRSQILGMDIRLVEICLAQEVTILDFWVQLLSFFWDAEKGEWMAFPCVVPTVKNWWAALMVLIGGLGAFLVSQNIPLGFVRVTFTHECQTGMRWTTKGKAADKCSAYVGTPWTSISGDDLMTLVKMLPILCNAVIKANRTLKYKTYLNKKKIKILCACERLNMQSKELVLQTTKRLKINRNEIRRKRMKENGIKWNH